jgi:hypothetical protein
MGQNHPSFARPFVRWVALAIAFLFTVPLLAQTAARVHGTVTDQTGAVIPGAKVSATNVRTQVKREVVANAEGLFTMEGIDPGIYNIVVQAKGFAQSVMSNLEVNVAGIYEEDFKLTIGTSGQIVEVVANQVAVQTSDSTISRAITLKDIDTLPALNRTPITLAVFQPGVQVNPGDTSYSRIGGQRLGSNNATLDGIDVNDSVVPRLGLSMTANNTDSVGEFRIVTQGAKAEYGRNAGGQVEMITRTGTNQYHGNAFDYLRNTDLNANDYFNKQSGGQRPQFIQNIFGGSFGGPIKKNKLFIFGNLQMRRTHQQIVRNRTVLTAAAKQGIFTYCANGAASCPGATSTYNIAANDPRGIGIDKYMKTFMAIAPDPNNTDVGDGMNTAGYRFNGPNNSMEDQFTIRGDYNITDRMKTFLRWSWQRNSSIDSLNSADAPYPGLPQGTQGGHRWGFSVGHDWTITNNLVNEARVGYQSASVAFVRPQRIAGATVITNLFNPDPINSAYPQGRNSPVEDFIDNMTMTHGKHIFKWGGKISYTKQVGYNDGGIWYNITTGTGNGNTPLIPAALAGIGSTQQTQFQSLYNDVLGRMDSVAHTFYSNDLSTFVDAGVSRTRDYRLHEHGYYFQDDWKVLPNLTLNLGIRWELFLPPYEADNKQAYVANANEISPTTPATDLTVARGANWYKTDWNNFAPRVGFAWDVRGDGKTAVRGNYGVFYDRVIGAVASGVDGATPGFSQSGTILPATLTSAQLASYGCAATVPVGDVRVSDCLPVAPKPASPSLTLPISNRTTTIELMNPNLRTGYVHSFSLTVQRELLPNTILEVGYVGNLGTKLFMLQDMNQIHVVESGFLSAFKELQAFQSTGAAPSASNPLVKMFGTAGAAITAMGSTNVSRGNVGTAANTVDRSYNSKYAAAGLPQTWLRNYPQYNLVEEGTNAGHSYYHALQVSLRRQVGALKTTLNYTWSHSIDTLNPGGSATSSAGDGNGFASPVDNFNLLANRANSDFDHRQSFNASVSYTLPVGRGKRFGSGWSKWLDTFAGGWEVGSVVILQDGAPFSVSSTRTTYSNDANTYADYNGATKNIGNLVKKADGSVWWMSAADLANFAYPAAGTYGTSGRNAFRLPGYFDIDSSLVKRFKITERQGLTFRAEAYNLINHSNFTTLGTSLTSPSTFGKLSGTTGPAGTSARNLQLTLRYDF